MNAGDMKAILKNSISEAKFRDAIITKVNFVRKQMTF